VGAWVFSSALSILMYQHEIDQSLKNHILKNYIFEAARNYRGVVYRNDGVNFPCNICGDSSYSKRKKRGWFKFLHGRWFYRCWNCGASIHAEWWLKEYHPDIYHSYFKELMRSALEDNKDVVKQRNVVKLVESKEHKYDEKDEAKTFRPILSSDKKLFVDAINTCKKRNIPDSVYSSWFVSVSGVYKNRIIIPFYNQQNRIIYWQGRSIYNKEPKYLNCKKDKNEVIQNQLRQLDKSKPIILLEGYIDSIFVENSLFTFSTNWSTEHQKEFDKLDVYYLLDYDVTSETRKKQQQLLKAGKWVFNWKKFIKDNELLENVKWDVNSLYVKQCRRELYSFYELEKYFTKSWYDKFWFV